MKIVKFWVVTKPTPNSTLEDILIECDIERLRLQFLGGLKTEEIVGIYTDGRMAKWWANNHLRRI